MNACDAYACMVNSTPRLSPKGILCWLQGRVGMMDSHVEHLDLTGTLQEARAGDGLEEYAKYYVLY